MPVSSTQFPVLDGLAGRLRAAGGQFDHRWELVDEQFVDWAGSQPDLLGVIREELRALDPAEVQALGARSRETTTHFAWRLVDEPGDGFSFWLHEYKPQRDWLRGYANTVHNHRYHFCTLVLAGGYRHEWFDVKLDTSGQLAYRATLAEWELCGPGVTKMVLADRFHRIPLAKDSTATLLIKSRPVRTWSLSVDPATQVSRRHVPVEVRAGELAERL